jgi:hypothetical protein
MKLSKTLWCVSFIVIAAFLMPVLAGTPLGQIDSMDDIGGGEWWWDVEPYRSFDPNLNLIDYENITLWVKSDPNGAYLKQIILYDDANSRIGRYDVPAASTPSWRKVTAPLAGFVWEGGSSTTIDRIGLWTSCSDTHDPPNAHDIYLDDLRVNEPNDQLDSMDDINDINAPFDPNTVWVDARATGLMLQETTEKVEGTGSMHIKYTSRGWYDGRNTGWMLQTPPGDANYHEGTGSMMMAFTLWEGGNVDVEPTMNFDPPLDFNDWHNLAITLWVWSDRSNSKFREIILYDIDDPCHNGRFVVHPPDSNGWTKVVANLTAFSWYEEVTNYPISPYDANWNSIKTIGLFSSTGPYPHDIYLDDLRLDSYQVVASDATIVNADRTFGTITVDGNAADWANLDDSDVVDFDLAAVPNQPHGNLHVKYRLAWDPNYLYILVQEQPGDLLATEANTVGGGLFWNMNDGTGGDAYYDALTLYFDFTNSHWVIGGEEGISLWLFLGLASHGQGMTPTYPNPLMLAWTNADWGHHKPAALADGIYPDSNYAETGTGVGNRVVEARISWQDVNNAVDSWRLPEGGLPAAIKPGYIFGCNPRLNDFEKSTLWGSPTIERGTAWLNGKLWDWQGTPSATGIYAKDVRLVCSAGDLNGDCHVNFVDYAQFAEEWLNDGCNNLNGFCNGADIVINGEVNMEDLAKFTQRWLD